ncbi:MAG: primosome assembly protein PriA [Candidatus Saccharibacteria bacterium]|nr:primosome assembly protein PriA [Candidatus Saccharibacteria bacterium]
MHYFEVAPNQIVRPGHDVFTYSSETALSVGQLVVVEVGKKQMIGLIMRETKEPTYKTKPISLLIEDRPLPDQLVRLASWLAEYYVTPLSLVLQTLLPRGLQTVRRANTKTIPAVTKRNRTNIVFNKEQSSVIKTLESSDSGTFLLQGVTGSGKTEIYIELAKQMLEKGQSTIVLVPEIALTSQIIAEFSHHFKDILVVHSTITEAERHTTWREALHSTTPRVVIGARSALFTPLPNVGAIIVDEAHEPSYKQEQAPRYSALRAATMLGRFHDARVIFGSATPTVADRYLAEQSGRPILKLTTSARTDRIAPTITLVDMTKRANFNGHRFLSKQLLSALDETLTSGKQALIFHNRRGSASSTLCENCGWTAECPRCFVPLTLHNDQHLLRCHICDHQEKVPTMCPVCHHVDIIHKGFGTKLIESELRKLYPKANIARFDADNDAKQTVNARYSELYSGEINIAIGTQVVAKGLDLPHLRTVGVIQADGGLALPDFSTSERTFQLLAQVVGRVGRNEHQTQVIVQSYQPTHPSVAFGLAQDYDSFYDYALKERKKALFPPFTYLLKLTCSFKTEAASIKASKALALDLQQRVNPHITILGPTPAFYERQRDSYRWQLVLKSPKREYLIEALAFVPVAHWQSELDPTSLL